MKKRAEKKMRFPRRYWRRRAREQESHVGFWLRFVAYHISRRLEKELRALGLSASEWVAMRAIARVGHGSHHALQKTLGMTKGAVSKIVTRLELQGMLVRIRTHSDRRAQRLELTKFGTTVVPIFGDIADEIEAVFFGHLPMDRRAEMLGLLKQIVRIHGFKWMPLDESMAPTEWMPIEELSPGSTEH